MTGKLLRLGGIWVWLVGALFGAPSEKTERLAELGKLWAEIKLFHPWLAYRSIDWDKALLEALPKAAQARTAEEYREAVRGLLSALGDPATRVIPPRRKASQASRISLLRWEPGGVAVLTLNPQLAAAWGTEFGEQLRGAAAALTRARGLVVDLRQQAEWTDWEPATLARWFVVSGLNQRLAGTRLKIPGQRARIHSGLASAGEGGSAYFHSGFYVRDGGIIEGNGPSPRVVVFLVDPTSSIPPIALALQAAGRAAVVAVGGLSDGSLVECYRKQLAGGILVQVRASELLYEDGTTGLVADVEIAEGGGEGARDSGLETAIALARHGSFPPRANRPVAPAHGVQLREHSYPEYALPPWELRVLGLFRIWAAIRYFFAYRHLMDADWDEALLASLPKVEQVQTPREYALAIAELLAHTQDSHVSVERGAAVREAFPEAQPPIRTRLIEGKPVITAVLDRRSRGKADPEVGDIIVEVDGEEALSRLRRLERYVAASTRQSMEHLLMQQWLRGAPGTSVKLRVRGSGGDLREVVLERAARNEGPWRSGPVVTVLKGNVGYVDLDRLLPQQVDGMFEELKGTKAIIFDMRGYPKGTGWLIAPRLATRPGIVAARFSRPLVVAPAGWLAGDVETREARWEFLQYLPETDKWKYTGRTVMLIDERAMSQAEHLGLFLEAANGTVFIGSPTAGADGDIARFSIPGGLVVTMSGHEVRHADGRQLQRIGLVPKVLVKPTIAGIRAGRDEVLEKALEWLGVKGVRVKGVGEAR